MGDLSDHEAAALREALRLSRGGDLAAAEPIFHAVLKTNHRDPFAEWVFGCEYLNHDKPDEAVGHFRRAIERDDRCAPAWGGLGRALKDLGQWDEAEAALRRRLELGESANHHVFLAMVLLEQSRFEDALACCERALHLDDRQVDALIIQGFASSLLGRHEKALEFCRRAVAVDEHYSEAQNCLKFVMDRANMPKIIFRPETPDDSSAVREVNQLAFGGDVEARLVAALHAGGYVRVSLVAEEEGRIVGHILFSDLPIVTPVGSVEAWSLAPLAVVPDRQRAGIGSALVREGLRVCAEQGCRIVLVVGHPEYYPRFGFAAERAERLKSPYAGPAFMALELTPGALDGVEGEVRYPPPFDGL